MKFLDQTKEIDPHFIKLFEEVTGHKIKKKDQDKELN